MLRCVIKTYGSGDAAVYALRGVDLDIPPGELVVVLGPSGSGKTTLINIIGGIETATVARSWWLARTSPDAAGGPERVPPPAHRVRVPVLQSGTHPDRAGERRGAGGADRTR